MVVALEISAKGFIDSPVTSVAIRFHVAQGKEKNWHLKTFFHKPLF